MRRSAFEPDYSHATPAISEFYFGQFITTI